MSIISAKKAADRYNLLPFVIHHMTFLPGPYVTEHFKVILKNHGLDKIRFHDLRHSCAFLMLSKKKT